MKPLLRLWHELETLQSWLFDGDPHIDGHLWAPIKLEKIGDKYHQTDRCECGKVTYCWMSEMMYIQTKHLLPKDILI